MSDRSPDELRKRFSNPPSEGDDDETEDTSAQSSGEPASPSSDSSNPSEIDKTDDGSGIKERKQVAMYLPADQRESLVDLHEELDARSKLDGSGGIEKNREFYEGVVEFVLDRRREFAAELGVELPEDE